LEDHAEESTVKHGGTSEDLVPMVISARVLFFHLLSNVFDFIFDEGMVDIVEAFDTSHCATSFIMSALAVGEPRGFWKKEDGDS
jgi:hypothetical protein